MFKVRDKLIQVRDIHYSVIRHEISIVKFHVFHRNRTSFPDRKQAS
jgi:hypothetical protein